MSHYSRVKSKIMDKECLVKALKDMGFSTVNVFNEPRNLQGYQGDTREEKAEIIIPRKAVGGAANDIGFKLEQDGTWGAIISEYDGNSNNMAEKNKTTKGIKNYGQAWLDKLTQRYTYHKTKDQLEMQGFFVTQETEEDGEIYLEVDASSWSY